MYDHVVVPLDGSLQAEHALSIAVEEARRHRATLVLVHVIPHAAVPSVRSERGHAACGGPRCDEDLRAATHLGRRYLDGVAKRCHLPSWTTATILIGEPVHEVLAVAERLARPLVVVAIAGAPDIACPPVNPVGRRLVDESTVPVLGVPIASTATSHGSPRDDTSRPVSTAPPPDRCAG